MTRRIVWLDRGETVGRSEVGGKGLGLARITEAGLAIPPAFVVTAAVFEEAVGERLRGDLDGVGRALPGDPSMGALEETAARLRRMVTEATKGHPGEEDIMTAYRELARRTGDAEPGVAVRSSSAAEDSEMRSFAGEHDTYLWVTGEEELLERVRACWASLFTARAISYGRQGGERRPAMAVVVQHMVQARAAGVMMTLNPANGDPSKILIEAVWGLGEPLVAGEVNPDRILVDKVIGEVVRRELAHKPTRLVRDPVSGRGVATEEVEPELRDEPCLGPEEVRELVGIGRTLERAAGAAQDVEFATSADRVMVLQTRPETVWSHRPRPAVGFTDRPVEAVVATLTRVQGWSRGTVTSRPDGGG